MKIEQLVEKLELMKYEIEWEYPLDCYVALEEAIQILENYPTKCSICGSRIERKKTNDK